MVPEVGVSYSHSAFIDGTGRLLGIYQMVGTSPTSLALCVTRNPLGNGSNAVIRTDVFNPDHPNCTGSKVEHFFFDEELCQAEDFELWVRIATQTRWLFDCISVPLTLYRINPEGLSSDVRAQRGYHYLALVKIFAYAPDVIKSLRTTNIAYLYWYLARVLLPNREPRKALRHCRAALRFDASTFGVGGFLLIAASALQCLLPLRVYSMAERLAFRAFGKIQV